MKCHYCGAEIRTGSLLHCPVCGKPLDSVTQQLADFRQQTQKQSVMEPEPSPAGGKERMQEIRDVKARAAARLGLDMKFYGFLVSYGLYALALILLVAAAVLFLSMRRVNGSQTASFLLAGIICTAGIGLCLLSRQLLAGHKSSGPLVLYILTSLLFLLLAVSAVRLAGTGKVLCITGAVLLLILLIYEVNYFQKRKFLFGGSLQNR